MAFLDPEVPPNLIEETRAAFLKELEIKGESVIHPKDLEKVQNNDYYLKRFLMHNDADQKLALEMMWEALVWRKEYGINDFSESNLRMDLLLEGIFFTPGRDRDGHPIFVFKCKKHTKGKHSDEIKKIIVYWIERLEKQEQGKPITIFFDMDGCGVSNMDLDIVKYLISVFKQYYPYMLYYIIVFEMQWILNAGFKIIKSWLPAKALERLRVIKKPDLNEFVALDQALVCWGGNNDYNFTFVPESQENSINNNQSNKKVHFADRSSPVDNSLADASVSLSETGMLCVTPASAITFVKEGNEMVSTLELRNIDNKTNLSYKMKTTSPEKFKVRPSAGFLIPGAHVIIHVTLLQGYHIGGLSKDKFLVMSMPVESIDLNPQELADLWKNTSGKEISQHRLRCIQNGLESAKNGTAIMPPSSVEENAHLTQITTRLKQLNECQMQLNNSLRRSQILQWFTLLLVFVIGTLLAYKLKHDNSNGYCYKNDDDID